MTREEKIKLAIEKGYTYDEVTGKIFNRFGKEIKGTTKDYIVFNIYKNNKTFKVIGHQFAWYYINKECVTCIDHINGIKDDNRICNLRSITQQKNCFNKKSIGVSYRKDRSKYSAYIYLNNKKINLGSYITKQEAINIYLESKKIYHII